MALNMAFAIVGTGFVCTSMVMDEEVLVLYCFVLFVGAAYQYGSATVQNLIETETSKIGKEFDTFFDLQKKVIQTLISYHTIQLTITDQLKSLLTFSKEEVQKILAAKKLILEATLIKQVESKLSFLASKEQAIVQNVQIDASNYISSKILEIFTTDHKDKKSLKEKILAENIAKLETL